ncbi:MAG: PhzF family phenazine biosynthesis protein [Bacteroidota bacterium]|nr:PhzF family phenazine biosynthesis protein [Bacteroidota bacterium]
MVLKLYQIDAFTGKIFAGNPAAVIPLEKWIDDDLMQQIAMENNLSETVFFVPVSSPSAGGGRGEAGYDIRWFTPELEINLCGHATLASAYVLYNLLGYKKSNLIFNSKSGKLEVKKEDELLTMNFPSWKPEKVLDYSPHLQQALGVKEIIGVYKHRDLLVELNNEDDVKYAAPDFTLLKKSGDKVIITAPGKEVDFVSRFFAPTAGINEDPVTGSAHSQLIPFWSEKLGKTKMRAKQLSKRGGDIYCEQKGERVMMGGECVFFMQGKINIKKKDLKK